MEPKLSDRKPFDLLHATSAERDAWFLRMYANHVARGTERTLDIPSVIAGVLDGIANRIEEVSSNGRTHA